MFTCSVQNQGTNSFTASNYSIRAIAVNHAISNGPLTTITPQNIRINAQLQRGGATTTIIGCPVFVAAKSRNTGAITNVQLDANLPYLIQFPQVINLKSDDKLIVTITCGSLGQVGGGATEAQFTTTVTAIAGVGIESYTPVLITNTVPSGQNDYNFPAGDYVTDLAVFAPDNKITSMTIGSDYLTQSLSLADFYALRSEQYYSSAPDPTQVISIFSGFPLRQVAVRATINNAISGDVYLTAWKGETNPTVQMRAASTRQKVDRENSNRF